MSDAQESAPEQQESNSSKIVKRFETTIAKLTGILTPEGAAIPYPLPKKKPKIARAVALEAGVNMLTKRQQLQKEKLEEDLSKLMDDYFSYEASMEEARKAAKVADENKMKELCDKADKILREIEGVDAIGQRVAQMLQRGQQA